MLGSCRVTKIRTVSKRPESIRQCLFKSSMSGSAFSVSNSSAIRPGPRVRRQAWVALRAVGLLDLGVRRRCKGRALGLRRVAARELAGEALAVHRRLLFLLVHFRQTVDVLFLPADFLQVDFDRATGGRRGDR